VRIVSLPFELFKGYVLDPSRIYLLATCVGAYDVFIPKYNPEARKG
jgi:hypothetical protein